MICRGYGWIALFVTGLVATAAAATTGDPDAMNNRDWPLAASFLVMAWPVFFLGRWARSLLPREYLDAKTAERVVVERKHRLFWMPLDYAAFLMIGIGMLGLWMEFLG